MIQRTVFLGEEVTAYATFLDANGNPLNPLNSLTPMYYVKDVDQDVVTVGVGTYDEGTKSYSCTFTVPTSASISTENNKYTIEWEFISILNETIRFFEPFDVIHPSFNEIVKKEQQKITLPFLPVDVNVPLPSIPDSISLKVYDLATNESIYEGTPEHRGIYTGYYIYTATIPKDTLAEHHEYLAVISFIINGSESVFTQKIHCIDVWVLGKISDLRMYVDKVQKDADLYTGYRDSDLLFHIKKGLLHLNVLGIPTNWRLDQFKSEIPNMTFGLDALALHSLLRSQYMAEGDLAFNFSGQPVSLDMDRTGFIESEIGRLDGFIDSTIKPAKTQAIKRSYGPGHLGLTYPTISRTNPVQLGSVLNNVPSFINMYVR